MKKNEELEQALQELEETGDTWASWDVLRAYRQSRDNNNLLLNIHEINGTISEITMTLRKAGIKEFTLSENSTAVMEHLLILNGDGAKLEKMTCVQAPWTDYKTDDWEIISAVKLTLK